MIRLLRRLKAAHDNLLAGHTDALNISADLDFTSLDDLA